MKKFRYSRKICSMHTKVFVFTRKLESKFEQDVSALDYDVAQWCLCTNTLFCELVIIVSGHHLPEST